MPVIRRVRVFGCSILTCVIALGACRGDSSGPVSGDLVTFSIVPVFASAGIAGIVEIAQTRVRLARSNETVAVDTLITVPEGADSVTLEVQVVVNVPNEAFQMTVDFITPTGEIAFTGGPVTVQPAAAGTGEPQSVQVPTTYVGVGAGAASVRIVNQSAFVVFGASAMLTAEALDAQGQPIPGTPIGWSSLDPNRASVPDAAVGTIVGGTEAGTARIVAALLTGPADTLVATVAASSGNLTLLFHASGISDFTGDPDLSGRFFEIVDPVGMVVFPALANSRGDEEVTGLAYDPLANRVYVTDRACALIRVDPLTGAETLVGNTSDPQTDFCSVPPEFLKGLAFEPGTNRLLAGVTPEFSDGVLYEVDPLTAAVTAIGQVLTAAGDTVDGYNGFSFDPVSGQLFVVGHLQGDVLRDRYLMAVNVTTLIATPIALLSENGVASITFTSDGTLYAVTGDGANTPETLWTVNTSTAVMTVAMPLGNGDDGEAVVAIRAQSSNAPPGAVRSRH